MTHFLLMKEREPSSYLRQHHAAVPVQVDLKEETCTLIEPGIIIAGADVIWAELPERFKVVHEGKAIKRDKNLVRLVSLSTFDPCHLIADVRKELWPWSRR